MIHLMLGYAYIVEKDREELSFKVGKVERW